jgi:hypothetical protein
MSASAAAPANAPPTPAATAKKGEEAKGGDASVPIVLNVKPSQVKGKIETSRAGLATAHCLSLSIADFELRVCVRGLVSEFVRAIPWLV